MLSVVWYGQEITGCKKGIGIRLEMKEYFKYFRWVFIIIAVLAVILAAIKGAQGLAAVTVSQERTNTKCETTQRVFDYADVLTDREEKKLEKLICRRRRVFSR